MCVGANTDMGGVGVDGLTQRRRGRRANVVARSARVKNTAHGCVVFKNTAHGWARIIACGRWRWGSGVLERHALARIVVGGRGNAGGAHCYRNC